VLRQSEHQARTDLATAHEGVTQLQACMAQQQASKHHAFSRQSPASTSAHTPSTPPSQVQQQQLQRPVQTPQQSRDQAPAADLARVAAAEAECQMLRRQLRQAQLQLQQHQAPTSLSPTAPPPSLHYLDLQSSATSSHNGRQSGEASSSCAASSYTLQQHSVLQAPAAYLNLAHVADLAGLDAAQACPQQALQVQNLPSHPQHHQLHDVQAAVALSAKEARIFELRGALAQCQAERGALAVQLEVGGMRVHTLFRLPVCFKWLTKFILKHFTFTSPVRIKLPY